MELRPASNRHVGIDKGLVLVVGIVLAVAACTNSDSSPTTVTDDGVTTTTLPGTSENSTVPSPTVRPQVDPEYYAFESTMKCDPDAEDADLQVVQAFFTAYNERNLQRLEELVAPNLSEIWDPSGLPHTGQVLNTDVSGWAQAGWEVDDRFELVLLVSYGQFSGSDILLLRRSEVLKMIGIDGMVVGFKVPSSGCTISRLIGHIDPRVLANCPFYGVHADELRKESGSDWEVPSLCAP